MNESIFRTEMARAEGLKGVDPTLTDYFMGYMRGLRRAYHGEKFGTEEEHEKWLSLIDDQHRWLMGLGYTHGLKGQVFNGKDYCTQNVDDCETCSLVSFRKDCQNNPI